MSKLLESRGILEVPGTELPNEADLKAEWLGYLEVATCSPEGLAHPRANPGHPGTTRRRTNHHRVVTIPSPHDVAHPPAERRPHLGFQVVSPGHPLAPGTNQAALMSLKRSDARIGKRGGSPSEGRSGVNAECGQHRPYGHRGPAKNRSDSQRVPGAENN